MHWRKYHIAVLSNLVEDLISHGWGYLGVKLVDLYCHAFYSSDLSKVSGGTCSAA